MDFVRVAEGGNVSFHFQEPETAGELRPVGAENLMGPRVAFPNAFEEMMLIPLR